MPSLSEKIKPSQLGHAAKGAHVIPASTRPGDTGCRFQSRCRDPLNYRQRRQGPFAAVISVHAKTATEWFLNRQSYCMTSKDWGSRCTRLRPTRTRCCTSRGHLTAPPFSHLRPATVASMSGTSRKLVSSRPPTIKKTDHRNSCSFMVVRNTHPPAFRIHFPLTLTTLCRSYGTSLRLLLGTRGGRALDGGKHVRR